MLKNKVRHTHCHDHWHPVGFFLPFQDFGKADTVGQPGVRPTDVVLNCSGSPLPTMVPWIEVSSSRFQIAPMKMAE